MAARTHSSSVVGAPLWDPESIPGMGRASIRFPPTPSRIEVYDPHHTDEMLLSWMRIISKVTRR